MAMKSFLAAKTQTSHNSIRSTTRLTSLCHGHLWNGNVLFSNSV